ncbi:MAG TPA: hypothetical protein VMF89_03315, partial [Polyangiales bacterium]|nr:hypothetical protein [Polyangiales bacterium]
PTSSVAIHARHHDYVDSRDQSVRIAADGTGRHVIELRRRTSSSSEVAPREWRTPQTLLLTGSVAGLLSFVTLGVVATNERKALDDKLAPTPQIPLEDAQAARSKIHTFNVLADVGLGVSALCATLVVVTFFTQSSNVTRTDSLSIAPLRDGFLVQARGTL